MDVGVKRKDELGEWLKKDPIARLREDLYTAGLRHEEFERIERELKREVEDAVAWARESPYPPPEELLRHVFHEERDHTR